MNEISIIDSLAENDELLPIHFNYKYLSSVSPRYGHLNGLFNRVKYFIIPYTITDKKIYKYLTFHSSPFQVNSDCGIKSQQLYKDFVDSLVIFADKFLGVDFISQPPPWTIFKYFPRNAIGIEFGSYRSNLLEDESTILSEMNPKHRNMISRANRQNFIFKELEIDHSSLLKVHDILTITMNRSNLPFDKIENFENKLLSIRDIAKIFGVFENNILIACGVFPYSKFAAYYEYGGSLNNNYVGAMNLLHWNAMLYFKKLGVQYYDFVGARINPPKSSKYYSIQKFKQGFSTTLDAGYIWKIRITWKYYIYKLNMLIRSPKGDIIDQEKNRTDI